MSKITKKQLHNGWFCHDTEIIKMKKELRELKQSVLRLEKLTDEKLLDESELKQLDQSVFDGLDNDYMFAAIDGCTGRAYAYEQKPHIPVGKDYWRVHDGMQHPVEHGYDTTNWQNSLIERDKVELTGSDLCRAMLARGDKYVLSDVGGGHNVQVIGGWTEHGFTSRTNQFCLFRNPIPINNQGEPLTASEVGL